MNQDNILEYIGLIDLTSLSSSDNSKSIRQLIDRANTGFKGAHPAAVCTYSNHSGLLSSSLKSGINSAIVAGYFPSGQASLDLKKSEYEQLAHLDVDEIDIVINRGELIAGNIDFTTQEIKMAREIFIDKKLKVILESGELSDSQLSTAAKIAIDLGADFIKTSTGKGALGATPEAVNIMCDQILLAKKKTGIKISGGVRTLKDVILYSSIVCQKLGGEYINKDSFRIGASSLFDELIKEYNIT